MSAPAEVQAEPAPAATAVIYLRVSTDRQAMTDFDADGYSIKGQREACLRKAKQMGATVKAEYVDRGESARTRDRSEFQRMSEDVIAAGDIDYVIVHKLDRFARNRVDDALMTLALQKAGAQLVSCSENIDDTPSGALLHGIMASISEFYSKNLATEVKKGFEQRSKLVAHRRGPSSATSTPAKPALTAATSASSTSTQTGRR